MAWPYLWENSNCEKSSLRWLNFFLFYYHLLCYYIHIYIYLLLLSLFYLFSFFLTSYFGIKESVLDKDRVTSLLFIVEITAHKFDKIRESPVSHRRKIDCIHHRFQWKLGLRTAFLVVRAQNPRSVGAIECLVLQETAMLPHLLQAISKYLCYVLWFDHFPPVFVTKVFKRKEISKLKNFLNWPSVWGMYALIIQCLLRKGSRLIIFLIKTLYWRSHIDNCYISFVSKFVHPSTLADAPLETR